MLPNRPGTNQERVPTAPEAAAKEKGARLMCGARRLNGKIGFEKCRAGFPGAADSPEGESAVYEGT